MPSFSPAELRSRREKVPPFEIQVTSYKLGERWCCSVDNVDPGATLAREQGPSREEAERLAVAKARELLGRTRLVEGS